MHAQVVPSPSPYPTSVPPFLHRSVGEGVPPPRSHVTRCPTLAPPPGPQDRADLPFPCPKIVPICHSRALAAPHPPTPPRPRPQRFFPTESQLPARIDATMSRILRPLLTRRLTMWWTRRRAGGGGGMASSAQPTHARLQMRIRDPRPSTLVCRSQLHGGSLLAPPTSPLPLPSACRPAHACPPPNLGLPP
jgi:hypothetical protein